MKIVHLSTSDISGGAPRATYRLHNSLRLNGIDSLMYVSDKSSDDFTVMGPQKKLEKALFKVSPFLDSIPNKFLNTNNTSLISPAWLPNRVTNKVLNLNPDVINLHWVCKGFIRPESLNNYKKPLVWTLHDMWAFSGGEHYVGECQRYIEGYHANNRPQGESGLDINRWVWRRKLKSWSKVENLTLVTPSKWLADCTRKSKLLSNRKVVVIPNGLDHNKYKPIDKFWAREILSLPKEKKIILFGALGATSDKRKGFHLLLPALQKLSSNCVEKGYEVVIFGASEPKDPPKFGFNTHYLGKINDDLTLSLVYSAADVFVAPSIEDNLPSTVMESLACGTPVVAFNIGGMPDMIDHKENGYLAKNFETEDLAEGIMYVLGDELNSKQLSHQAREKVIKEFTLGIQAENYIKLYQEILDN